MSKQSIVECKKPTLTQEAMKELYSSDFIVITEVKLAKRVKRSLQGLADTLVLNTDGLLITYSEYKKDRLSDVVQMRGAPTGLRLFVSHNKFNRHISAIADYCIQQGLHEKPLFLNGLGLFGWKLRRELLQFVIESYSLSNLEKATLRNSLTALRLSNERNTRNLSKLRRVIEGLNYNGYSLMYETPVGSHAVGPGGNLDVSALSQHLPCDVSSLFAFEVYVKMLPDIDSGNVEFMIQRISDGLVVSEFEVLAKNLKLGWNLFELEHLGDDIFGEVNLNIRWGDNSAENIQFALSDRKANGFGLDINNSELLKDTLALKLWQGSGITVKERPEDNHNIEDSVLKNNSEHVSLARIKEQIPADLRNTMQAYKFPELTSRIKFLHGDEKHRSLFNTLDFWPLMLSDDFGYMQTHPLVEELSGAIMYAGASEGTKRVRAKIRTANAAAPDLFYILARIPVEISDDIEAIKAALVDIKNIDKTGRAEGIDATTGIIWSSLLLPADTAGVISLNISEDVQGTGNLLFATMPQDKNISWGWCRWYSLYIDSTIQKVTNVITFEKTVDRTSVN